MMYSGCVGWFFPCKDQWCFSCGLLKSWAATEDDYIVTQKLPNDAVSDQLLLTKEIYRKPVWL